MLAITLFLYAGSKHMEAIRAGIQDYEYLAMLQRRIEEKRVSGDKSPALGTAEKLLATAAQRVAPDHATVTMSWWREKQDRSMADLVRLEILTTLLTLEE